MSDWAWLISGVLGGCFVIAASAVAAYWLRQRADERRWDATFARSAPYCRLYTWPDGRSEWLYVQPAGSDGAE